MLRFGGTKCSAIASLFLVGSGWRKPGRGGFCSLIRSGFAWSLKGSCCDFFGLGVTLVRGWWPGRLQVVASKPTGGGAVDPCDEGCPVLHGLDGFSRRMLEVDLVFGWLLSGRSRRGGLRSAPAIDQWSS